MSEARRADVIVVGAGPAGLAAACLLAEVGLDTCIIARSPRREEVDPRTVALMQPSVRLLRYLGIPVESVEFGSAPLWKLKLVDDTGGWLAQPPVTFNAREIGSEPFGWNIPIGRLIGELEKRAEALGVAILRDEASTLEVSRDHAAVGTIGGATFGAQVVVAADGSRSRMRGQAGISEFEWAYEQSAIAGSFAHSAPHLDTSTEFHKADGPLTTVPLKGDRSGLVWMLRPERARTLHGLPGSEFARILQAELHGSLGRISDIGPRRLFPMQGLMAVAFAGNRTLLVGEAAHVAPPLGAQGLNMSFRDAGLAAELIGDVHGKGEDPGSRAVMEAYDRRRRRDVIARQGVIHTVNWSLLSSWGLPHAARALGLLAGSRIPPARREIFRQGLGEREDLPRLMRE